MSRSPAMTVLLCTVRSNRGYLEHPEWTTLGKVFADLEAQTFKDFELVIVDGLFGGRGLGIGDVYRPALVLDLPVDFHARYVPAGKLGSFPVWHVAPRETIWTQNKKVAISTYRNTGIAFARGEWIVNLDDCCVLPPMYLEIFHAAHRRGQALGAIWGNHPMRGAVESHGGVLQVDPALDPPPIYGFGSYPRDLVIRKLNGYDEAYDGGQGLEDADFGCRLLAAGVKYWLAHIPGLELPAQSGHDSHAIDPNEPVVKCPNPVWHVQRIERRTVYANCGWSRSALERLVGPCWLLNPDDTCQHHRGQYVCAYLDRFAKVRHPLAERWLDEPPEFDLVRHWKLVQEATRKCL